MRLSRRSLADRLTGRDQRGSAVVDFVLVSLILVPLVLGIVHLALVLHVRNTLAGAAAEGARLAATVDRGPGDGERLTRQQITNALADRFARQVTATRTTRDGVPVIRVNIHAEVPPLGLWGPAVSLDLVGHAVAETP